MANFEAAFKEEIARLAKKEAKKLIEPFVGQFFELKKNVSDLKHKNAALSAQLAKLVKKEEGANKGIKVPPPEKVENARLGASNIIKLRTKLDLSRAEMAELLEVSPNSIFLWEKGEAKPREAAKAKIIALRTLGRRKIREMLDAKNATAQKPADAETAKA